MTTEQKCKLALFGGVALYLTIGLLNAARARADETAFHRALSSRPLPAIVIDLRP